MQRLTMEGTPHREAFVNRWDERYDQERYFYGRTPNYFVSEQLQLLEPGRGLYLAEGEGRNAVFAAGLGHRVTAIDSSAVGRRKALALATDRGVQISYAVGDATTHPWAKETWDHIVLCFAHFAPDVLADVHRRVAESLAPGGTLILVSYSKAQFGRKSGGPPDLDLLHDLEDLKGHFPGVDLDHAEEREVDLQEADGHRGLAMVIEITGTKT